MSHRLASAFLIGLAAFAVPALAQPTQSRVVHPSGAADDNFGTSVAVYGDTVIVGVPMDDVGANPNQGSVLVFRRAGGVWLLEATLTASDGAADDRFGRSVALFRDTAVVGAYLDNVGAIVDQGSAYVFTRSGTVWSQQFKIGPPDGAASDQFGISVALYGDTAVIGAPTANVNLAPDRGAAYVFTRAGSAWGQQAKLIASGGLSDDLFGSSVAIYSNTIVIGAPGDDSGTVGEIGSAYAFVRSGTVWVEQNRIAAFDGNAGHALGGSVAVYQDRAVVGATGSNSYRGSAVVFKQLGTSWQPEMRLVDPAGVSGDALGCAVAFSGDTAIVGANLANVGATADQGSAQLFTRSGTTWTRTTGLTASDGATNDRFGQSVAIYGHTVVVGVPFDDVSGTVDRGSVWILENPAGRCPADFDGSGALSVQDIFDFLNAWFANDPSADFNGTAGITIQDIFDFLNAWFAGC